jgi:hypothetical protein
MISSAIVLDQSNDPTLSLPDSSTEPDVGVRVACTLRTVVCQFDCDADAVGGDLASQARQLFTWSGAIFPDQVLKPQGFQIDDPPGMFDCD